MTCSPAIVWLSVRLYSRFFWMTTYESLEQHNNDIRLRRTFRIESSIEGPNGTVLMLAQANGLSSRPPG